MFCSSCGAGEQTGSFCSKCGKQVQGTNAPTYSPAVSNSNGLAISGVVIGIAALFFLPIILGPLGLIFGIIAKTQNQKSAVTAIWVSSVGTVAGLIFGAIVGVSLFS